MAKGVSRKKTRISLACSACRSRKHKCSGEKPRCAYCISNKITCVWPTQQKRGPPKQYIASLEKRLLETENVLLALLSHVSTEQLHSSFEQIANGRTAFSPSHLREDDEPQSSTTVDHGTFGPFHWSKFPLDSTDNVRRWWEERVPNIDGLWLRASSQDLRIVPLPDSHISTELSSISNHASTRTPEITPAVVPEQNSEQSFQVDENPVFQEPEAGNVCATGASAVLHPPIDHQRVLQSSRENQVEVSAPGRSEERERVIELSDQFKIDFMW